VNSVITVRRSDIDGQSTSAPVRDRYVDFLRAASLLVVVGWHWAFSIVTWHPGPGDRVAGSARPQRFTAWAGARSITVYLWHFPAFAAAYGLVVLAGVTVPQAASLRWWLERRCGSSCRRLLAYPCLRVFRRFEHR